MNKGMDLRKRQPPQAIISHSDDPIVQFIEEFEEMGLNMSVRQRKREFGIELLLYSEHAMA